MPNPDLSTVTDEQLCNTADLSGNPLMWELAERFRQASPIASAAREAGMVDEQGKFRKILGTLPVTADGCVAGLNCTLWRWNRPAQEMMRMELFHADRRSHLIEPIPSRATICVDLCYSTRSAAERAVKEQSDGH